MNLSSRDAILSLFEKENVRIRICGLKFEIDLFLICVEVYAEVF